MKPLQTLGQAACALAFLALSTPKSLAENLVELDFRNVNEDTRTTKAAAVYSGASGIFQLSEDDAVIHPEEATGIASKNAALKTGYLEIVPGSTGGGFLESTAETGTKNSPYYSAYAGGKGFGTGTMVFVFQPFFDRPLTGQTQSQRAYLFSNGAYGTSPNSVAVRITKEVGMDFGVGNTDVQRVTTAQPEWEPGKWYFIAVSWGGTQQPTVYVREIGAASGSFAEAAAPLVDVSDGIPRPIRIGNGAGPNSKEGAGAPMNGKLAYYLWSSDYAANQGDFEKIYAEIVKP